MTHDPHDVDPTGRLDLTTVRAGLILAGRYRLDALLAHSRGVMSWRAADHVLSRPVLIHLLEPEDERLGWVLQAARRAATVGDSRFLRVLDALEASGQEPWSFVVCEFAVGDSLQTLLADGALTSAQAGYIVREVAAGLAPLHGRGLFHLRLSPDSVIVTANGNVKIVGFLIDAALRPEPGEDALSWSEQEAIDVRGLGSLLYAATTARWPVPPSEPQRPTWGLSPAPLRGMPPASGQASEQVWPAPNEINRQADPEISAITMAILRPTLGLVGPSLRTADEVSDSLDAVVGATGTEESLENLVRGNRGLAAHPAAPAVLPTTTGWNDAVTAPVVRDEAELETQPMAAVRDPDPAPRPVRQPEPARPSPAAASEPAPRQRPTPVRAPPRESDPDKPQRAGAFSKRLIVVLLGFLVVALVALQIGGCDDKQPNEPVAPTSEATVASAEPVEIVAAFDFDPPADGGTADENASQTHLAVDGDPSTVWRTLTYLNNPVFGGLKPGVGLVFDLGREVPVSSVSLILDNQPNGLELRVPIEADPAAAKPPMNAASEWRVIAVDEAAGLQTTLSADEVTTTRWVMVYFTHLPPVGEALYRSGIAEAYINR